MGTNSKIGKRYPVPVPIRDEEIILNLPYKAASRKRSWLDVQQIEIEHWEVVDKIATILYEKGKNWTERSITFARSILDFIVDHDFITWKQYDSIMSIKTKREYQEMYFNKRQIERVSHRPGIVTLASGGKTFTVRAGVIKMDSLLGEMFKQATTDRDFDRLYQHVWGCERLPDDAFEYGTRYEYRDDGSRYEYEMDDDEADRYFDDCMSSSVSGMLGAIEGDMDFLF